MTGKLLFVRLSTVFSKLILNESCPPLVVVNTPSVPASSTMGDIGGQCAICHFWVGHYLIMLFTHIRSPVGLYCSVLN